MLLRSSRQGSRESPRAIIERGLRAFSLPSSGSHVEQFLTYLGELKKWNKVYNLTSLKTDQDVIIKHFLDSLLYLKTLPEGDITILDVGSGAGFPGIPLKIVRSDLKVFLLEPSWKKANFLRHIIKTLGLGGAEVIEKRIEDLRAFEADVALTRALFSVKDFVKKATPFVKDGGRLILSKGPKVKEEIPGILEGGLAHEIVTVQLPLTTIQRFLVIIRKGARGEAPETPQGSRASTRVAAGRATICANAACRLRKAGCSGFDGCPGYSARA